MRKNLWLDHELINGKGVTIPEIKTIYQSLLNDDERIKDEIVDSIECNDYVRLSHLLASRSKIQTAIKEVESLHEDVLKNYVSTKERVSHVLSNAAESLESKGEDVLLDIVKGLEKMSHSTHSLVTKSLDISSKAFSKGNQLNHKVGKFLVKKTSKGLFKLANAINKKS
ncbi:hypothetical protein [Cytobacillus horneckiae]|uniref:Uncharacterized protein n=1 Tax=Cytobacillus horneckiae TaxID=549687 RepID=A0A2N0ZIX5_9BACI|nr:hypothetical protein [Cytobacillus horneckiae]MEC1159009.1 hypothetical protein [Cytobacillus horneckiae]MED2937963.1 hypothetical protein [Cytobacillus horneckiae]PKG29470.1 hypothetical protein CWS20_08090 [Cytobacillus horneckiae]